jgi:hypothetical protein
VANRTTIGDGWGRGENRGSGVRKTQNLQYFSKCFSSFAWSSNFLLINFLSILLFDHEILLKAKLKL